MFRKPFVKVAKEPQVPDGQKSGTAKMLID